MGADLLRRALESRFDGVGLDENTIVFTPDHSDEWWSKDKRYWMAMRSFIKTDGVSPEQAASDICRRHQSLRPKLIDDLEGGEKIFVFKDIHRNLTGAKSIGSMPPSGHMAIQRCFMFVTKMKRIRTGPWRR